MDILHVSVHLDILHDFVYFGFRYIFYTIFNLQSIQLTFQGTNSSCFHDYHDSRNNKSFTSPRLLSQETVGPLWNTGEESARLAQRVTTSLPTFPSSLPPQRVFTRLLNVRSTCLVRSHSRCTENTAAPSHSFSWENTFLRASSRQFHASFLPCCDSNRLGTNGLRVRGTNNATHYDLSFRDFYEISLLSSRWSTLPQVFRKKKKEERDENLPGVSSPLIFVHSRPLNTERFKHRH